MKKYIFLFIAAFSLTLTSCGANNEADYNKGYDAGYAEGAKSVTDNKEEYNKGYEKGYEDGLKSVGENSKSVDDYKTVTVYGDFTATVQQIIPDYMYDRTTNRAAVVTLFQSRPYVILLNEDICSELQVGETYTFEVAEKEFNFHNCQLFDDNIVDYDLLSDLYITSFRTPVDDEYGIECWRVKYK